MKEKCPKRGFYVNTNKNLILIVGKYPQKQDTMFVKFLRSSFKVKNLENRDL